MAAVYYYYDPNGMLVGLNYNGGAYFYIRNVQGEIIKLISEAGAVKAEYTYDTWGSKVGITGSMAPTLGVANPFRYKGYYYDSEPKLYYLNSRYYNPEWGRFINADSYGGTTGNLLTHNLFAYCINNPVNAVDPSGHCFMLVLGFFGAIAGGLIGGAIAAATGGDFWTGAAIGAVAGGVIGLTCGAAASYVATGGATILASTSTVAGYYLGGAAATATAAYLFGEKAFETFQKLKEFLGSPGVNKVWHHIVEQCQSIKSGFSNFMINNTNNVISITNDVHAKISGYYSSIQSFSEGLRVRDWLAGQSFESQYQFGLDVLRMFGVIE